MRACPDTEATPLADDQEQARLWDAMPRDRFQTQRQIVLAREATGMTAARLAVSDHPSDLVGPQPLGAGQARPAVPTGLTHDVLGPSVDLDSPPLRRDASNRDPSAYGSQTTEPIVAVPPSVRDMHLDLTGPLPVTE